MRAFDVNAVDYLLKPFDPSRLEKALERVRDASQMVRPARTSGGESPIESQLDALLRLIEDSARRRAWYATRTLIIAGAAAACLLVDQAEICFAAIDEGVIRVVTAHFEGHSKCRTIEELLDQLDPALFWRAHRGFVVNINHIREVVPWFKSTLPAAHERQEADRDPRQQRPDETAARAIQSVQDTPDALGCGALAVASGGFAEE